MALKGMAQDSGMRERVIFQPNVPSDPSLLAFGIPPAREAESAGGMPKVPKGQGLGRLARWALSDSRFRGSIWHIAHNANLLQNAILEFKKMVFLVD